MKEILKRLLSPVIIVQILVTLTGVVIFFAPNQAEAVQTVVAAIVAIINLFAGLNNPSTPDKF